MLMDYVDDDIDDVDAVGEVDDDDDDDDNDDEDDDEDEERNMMMWMLRRRKRMILRRRRRRKTDPKTRKHTLCEPAQSKCTWTFHKSHFVEIYMELAGHGREHLEKTPGLNTCRKNCSVWPHCLGKNGGAFHSFHSAPLLWQ